VGSSRCSNTLFDVALFIPRDSRASSSRSTNRHDVNATPMKNFLTVDLECWFHSYHVRNVISRSRWCNCPPRLIEPLRSILSLFDSHGVTATFFILGWVAETYPDLVRMIDERGHEIASHGYWHDPVTSLSPTAFADDTTRSLEAIANVSNQELIGYRASNFSIVRETMWALDVLSELGFLYDSSIFPASRRRYGIATYPMRLPHEIQLSDGRSIYEVPLPARQLWRMSVPFAGGGYLRLYPAALTQALIRNENANNRPVVVYLHPWELDADQPRVARHPWSRFLAYTGLETTKTKLESLLRQFTFAPIRDEYTTSRLMPRTSPCAPSNRARRSRKPITKRCLRSIFLGADAVAFTP
jgi:polysaccharide deacetylase family protein (PEP-CTERM system associated)